MRAEGNGGLGRLADRAIRHKGIRELRIYESRALGDQGDKAIRR